jgi:hypothetical protein
MILSGGIPIGIVLNMARIILGVLLLAAIRVGLLILAIRTLTRALIVARFLLVSVAGVLLVFVLLVF